MFNQSYPAAELICLIMFFPPCSEATLDFCSAKGKLQDMYQHRDLGGQISSRNAEPPSARVEWASLDNGQAAWKEDKLQDVACEKGNLFQVYDLQTSFSHPTSRSHLSLSCASSQRDVRLQLVKKSLPHCLLRETSSSLASSPLLPV